MKVKQKHDLKIWQDNKTPSYLQKDAASERLRINTRKQKEKYSKENNNFKLKIVSRKYLNI